MNETYTYRVGMPVDLMRCHSMFPPRIDATHRVAKIGKRLLTLSNGQRFNIETGKPVGADAPRYGVWIEPARPRINRDNWY